MPEEHEHTITRHKIQQLISRILRTAKFDTETIHELKEDKTATGQAVAVLLLVGLSYGLGYSIFTGLQTRSLSPNQLISGTIANMIFTDFAVFIWSATVFLVGAKLFQGKTGYWQLARPLFFSTAPGTLFILIAIPFSPIIVTTAVIASAWIVSAEFVALKNAMGFNTQRALLTSVVGLLVLAFIQMTV
ncbi:MAG TPA: Yip1 family protein [Candidatus Bathyarchaeia archaeon]|nr:Yip1 family protein [Candidatus Bathyarchaeia archaeon]